MAGPCILVLAVEAALNPEVVADGNQTSFGRIRVRCDDPGIATGTSVSFTPPYSDGAEVFVAESDGRVRNSEDIGCEFGGADCDFGIALESRVFDGFLTCVDFQPGDAHIANPIGGQCQVKGSPTGNDFFRVSGPFGSFETDQFALLGQVAAGAATVN